MGRIEPREVVLEGGERIIIRTAVAADAAALAECRRREVEEGAFSVTQPDEFDGDPERMRERIEEDAATPTFPFLVAERCGALIGALITALLDWGAAHETIEKVRLGVFATNERATGLYRALGFVEEGRRRKEFRFGPGRYVDDIRMFQWVKPVEGETAVWRAKNGGAGPGGGGAG